MPPRNNQSNSNQTPTQVPVNENLDPRSSSVHIPIQNPTPPTPDSNQSN